MFWACSSEERTIVPENPGLNFRITNANAFISDFYDTSWITGRSRVAVDSVGVYNVTEIIVGSDIRARGYLIKDNNTGELLYFADVDRTGYDLKIVNLVTEESETRRDINLDPDYGPTNGFDFIQIIDDGDYVYVTNGFYTYGPCRPNNVGGGCSAGVFYTKNFLGIKGKEKSVRRFDSEGNDVGQQGTPCDCSNGEVTPYNPQ